MNLDYIIILLNVVNLNNNFGCESGILQEITVYKGRKVCNYKILLHSFAIKIEAILLLHVFDACIYAIVSFTIAYLR